MQITVVPLVPVKNRTRTGVTIAVGDSTRTDVKMVPAGLITDVLIVEDGGTDISIAGKD